MGRRDASQGNLFPERVFGSAEFSPCMKYRYELTRSWDAKKPAAAFIMLNPSTADAADDDPTIRRCIGFANRWGYGELWVYNVFALRSTDPSALLESDDPYGPRNADFLAKARNAARVVCAWGSFDAKGVYAARGRVVVVEVLEGVPLWCLGTTLDGSPRHPLYVKGDTQPVAYQPRA